MLANFPYTELDTYFILADPNDTSSIVDLDGIELYSGTSV